MEFLRPQLLFGLFALAIPIIIHLFNFRKTKKVYFSNINFLKQVKEASSSKLKLKHYLILLSRLLFIFFLVMAFAQPFIPGDSASKVSSKVIIYVDNSLSMSNEVQSGNNGLDEAIAHANKILNVYPKGTSFKLLTNGFNSFSSSYKSLDEVEDQLTRVRLSGMARTGDQILNRMSSSSDGNDSISVYWISDFQKSTFGENVIDDLGVKNINLIPIQFSSESNVVLDSMYLKNPFTVGGEQLKLGIVLRNLSKTEVTGLGIKVLIDEKQAATALIDVPALSSKEVSFDIGFDLKKQNKGRISIEDYPVTFDNDLYFVINQLPKIKVLEIRSEKSGSYVKNVFADRNLFDFKSYDISNLNYSAISQYDLIVVNELDEISTSLTSALNEKLLSKGSVFLIPSINPEIGSYKLLSNALEVNETGDGEFSNLATPDFNNPFFEDVFEERNPRFEMPKAKAVLNLGSDRTALIKFQNGKSFIRELRDNLFAISSPLKVDYNTFQTHALFVPVLYRLAAQSANFDDRLYYYTDSDFISFKMDSIAIDNVLKLKDETIELIPAQRIIDGKVLMEVPKGELNTGYYQLIYNDQVLSNLAFNAPQKESNLVRLNDDELNKLFNGKAEILNVDDELDLENELKNKYEGQSLWKLAIVLALVFLLCEVLLIRFFP